MRVIVDSEVVRRAGECEPCYSGLMGYPGSERFYWGEPVPNTYKEYNNNNEQRTESPGSGS